MAVFVTAGPLVKREDGTCVATGAQVCNVGGTYYKCDNDASCFMSCRHDNFGPTLREYTYKVDNLSILNRLPKKGIHVFLGSAYFLAAQIFRGANPGGRESSLECDSSGSTKRITTVETMHVAFGHGLVPADWSLASLILLMTIDSMSCAARNSRHGDPAKHEWICGPGIIIGDRSLL
ncbi:hypothetical protein BU23DRAFT_567111 [Bimuria novae-zelandiae CBS 107.79]|uniref:Uncharacterized protein n=1 Tax=Bimuria novae-zelandiae CBS 107.79 TaxID=1447943 RepID=A0A6A5VEB3_9PLEO|nr:hypothetical protein BU23DRAFT_567111 [Bimuria novae-zelandiae CBS 107.79]